MPEVISKSNSSVINIPFFFRCQAHEHFNNYRLFLTLAFSIYNKNNGDDYDEDSPYIGQLLPDSENCTEVLKKWKPQPHSWIESAKLRLLASKESHDVLCKVGTNCGRNGMTSNPVLCVCMCSSCLRLYKSMLDW